MKLLNLDRSLKNILRSSVLTLLFACSSAFVGAQSTSRETVDQSTTWFNLGTTVKLSQRWSASVDGQLAYSQLLENMQHQIAVSGTYAINSKISITPMGYAYTWNFKYGKQPAGFVNNEHRMFQQAAFSHKLNFISISHRLRVEERFSQNYSATNTGEGADNSYSVYQTRFRFRVVANVPLNKKSIEDKTLYLSIWDEAFVSRGKTITYHGINQNRFFAGLGYRFNKLFTAQGGFYSQTLIKSNGAKQENNLGVLVQVTYNIDLSKK